MTVRHFMRTVIIYRSTRGVESLLFQKYMSTLGHLLDMPSSDVDFFGALDSYPSAIVVLAHLQTRSELCRLAQQTRAVASAQAYPILIVADEPFDPRLPRTRVIARPYYLKDIAAYFDSVSDISL